MFVAIWGGLGRVRRGKRWHHVGTSGSDSHPARGSGYIDASHPIVQADTSTISSCEAACAPTRLQESLGNHMFALKCALIHAHPP